MYHLMYHLCWLNLPDRTYLIPDFLDLPPDLTWVNLFLSNTRRETKRKSHKILIDKPYPQTTRSHSDKLTTGAVSCSIPNGQIISGVGFMSPAQINCL